MVLISRDKNTAVLTTVLVPNNYQTVRVDLRQHIDKADGRLRSNLWELIIPIQNINTEVMSLVLSDSISLSLWEWFFFLVSILRWSNLGIDTHQFLWLRLISRFLCAWFFIGRVELRCLRLLSLSILQMTVQIINSNLFQLHIFWTGLSLSPRAVNFDHFCRKCSKPKTNY